MKMHERLEKEEGFTVVELLLALVITTILGVIAGMNYKSLVAKASMEKQIKMIYSDILEVRQRALLEKRPRTVEFSANAFKIFSGESAQGEPVLKRDLVHPIKWSSSDAVKVRVSYDTWGSTSKLVTIYLDRKDSNAPSVDCVVISRFRVRMGKNDAGHIVLK